MWKNLFEVANMMIYEGKKLNKDYNDRFINQVKKSNLSKKSFDYKMIRKLSNKIPSFREYINEIKNN